MVPVGTDLLECKQPWITVGSLFQLHKATKPWESPFTQLAVFRLHQAGTATQCCCLSKCRPVDCIENVVTVVCIGHLCCCCYSLLNHIWDQPLLNRCSTAFGFCWTYDLGAERSCWRHTRATFLRPGLKSLLHRSGSQSCSVYNHFMFHRVFFFKHNKVMLKDHMWSAVRC